MVEYYDEKEVGNVVWHLVLCGGDDDDVCERRMWCVQVEM